MTRLYKTLLGQMNRKIAIYRELIDVLRTEWDAVVSYSLKRTQEALGQKEILALKMQALEEERMKVVAEIAEKLETESEGLTLKKIVAMRDHPLNAKLMDRRETLLGLIDAIHELNEKNKHIVDRSSLSIKKSLAFLHRSQERAEADYHADGRIMETKRMQSRMLSAEG
ncbi:MAG: flagellar protein FlgN [Nitrospinales bacterium]